jgi:hypothetical protein
MDFNKPFVKSRKEKTGLTVQVGIVILGLAIGYFSYSQFFSEPEPIVANFSVNQSDDLSKFRDFKTLDLEILSGPAFQKLMIIGEHPVIPGQTGKEDIFAPF